MIILQDQNTKGKRKDWKGHKMQSLTISEAFRIGGDIARARRIDECGSYLNFLSCPDEHEKKLVGANFCRNPLCPMCMWRKGLLTAHQVWDYFKTRVGFTMALFNLLVQWNSLEPATDGFVPLSIAQFSL